jgi:hypothetical protein
MGGATGYQFLRLRHRDGDGAALRELLKTAFEPGLREFGGQVWGAWLGLFGLHSRDLVVMVSHPLRSAAISGALTTLLPDVATIEERYAFLPTARPEQTTPLARDGLYVFRFFDIRHVDAAEIVRLSREAWETFEASDAYASQPQGLFREHVPAGESGGIGAGRMLLVTWYDGFASWQVSRQPHPDALANFRRRAALTTGTIAIATRLAR